MSAGFHRSAVYDGKWQSHPVARLRSSPPDTAFGVHTRSRSGGRRKKGQDHVDIVITDYETNRVMDGGHIQSIAYRCFEDGNGTVQ
jgi:hypothetical protein